MTLKKWWHCKRCDLWIQQLPKVTAIYCPKGHPMKRVEDKERNRNVTATDVQV